MQAAELVEAMIGPPAPPEPPEPDIPYWEEIVAAAELTGIDPYLLAGIAKAESEFVPDKVGKSGERGLCQVSFPAWNEVMAESYQRAFEPALNLKAGARYYTRWRKWLSEGFDITDKQVEWGLVAYNWGPGNASRHLAAGKRLNALPPEVQAHLATYLAAIRWAREQ